MGFLKFLFIAFLVLYILRIIFRLVFPMVLKNMFSKVQQQAENQARQRNNKPEGDISIDYMPPQPKGGRTDKLGDFVDYEEIK
ncbi:DUF4834 family protein [Pedobacter steynii]|uniref:DUF4834 domain-containing protein n=1 Tax=Pedobacter steynii TaxID=430522 RepID=A0A1D7QDZ1_9SPHI|nr:DUF4834 family protein [Pedobacter steynii]AOM76870.1 DUF4834 domain-containing protein [Pedobacter steynii]